MTTTKDNVKIEKVFLWTSAVYHILDRTQPMLPGDTEIRRPALCGTKPYWPGEWITPDAPNLYGKDVASMSLCARCKVTMEALGIDEPA